MELKHEIMGRQYAWPLLASGAALASAHPLMASTPSAAFLAMLAGVGSAHFVEQWLGRDDSGVNLVPREGFVLPSDTPPELCMGNNGIRVGYTKDRYAPVDLLNNTLARHIAVIGQSGVGKTTFGEYVLWQQVARGGGFIFIDAKLDKETRDHLGYMARLAGREHELYVLNVDDPANSHTYNPLLQGDADEVASRLLNLMPSTENNPGSDHYRQAANHALTVLVGAMQAAKVRYNFSDLSIMLQSPAALERVARMVPDGPQRMSLQIFLDQYRKRTKEGVALDTDKLKNTLGGMAGRISQFAQGAFGAVFNTYTPEIDLTDIVKSGKMLYVMLPTMGKDTAALNLGKMILSDLRTATYNVQGLPKTARPNPPFLVFADEMGSYVMPGIARLFEQARSAGIIMMPAFQSFANLSAVSPDFADMLIQNTWSKVLFKFGSPESAEQAADIIGMQIVHTKSLSESVSDGTSVSPTAVVGMTQGESANTGVGTSYKEGEAYRVTTDQIMGLGIGEAIVVSGSRMFHVNTPMLEYPSVIEEYSPVRHPVFMPSGVTGLDLADAYTEFLLSSGGGGKMPAVSVPDPDDPLPPLKVS